MQLCLADILPADRLTALVDRLKTARFIDGKATAGWNAAGVKENQQAYAPGVAQLAAEIETALRQHPVFALAARPKRLHPILFARYEPGMTYGYHVDDPLMGDPPLRTDLALTLFLSDPETYDGGDLIIDQPGGEQAYKLPFGAAVLYPATTLHQVAPVTRGVRLVAITWIQSLIRDPGRREILFDLDTARRMLFARDGKSREFDLLSKSFANLLRLWAEP
ncbi:PKHD-type hydroxylase [Elstera cyanobacteriorum]|uniref:Fe2+-dependent dioxygenase n=1 Tax=Elstera cyanobacteriorum TaxID=2022747 RepID=A0A255XWV3_9PROT|nr:Fe2+-dependent dioxygenase [Elstera cyanobacteriorum]OYQ21413.1 Fe2+-dependent dioxygenase [Elstera cyanobacteriorum]GFZ96890.1 PKHD-type hydroxylase [Elstera cyanobacteriorum]